MQLQRLVMLSLAGVMTACAITSPAPTLEGPPVESAQSTDRAEIEEWGTDIQIPAGARDLHGYMEGWRETLTLLRFTIPPNDLPTVLTTTVCELPLQASENPLANARAPSYLTWWTPGLARTWLSCSGVRGHAHQTLLVDTTNPSEYVLYIVDSWY